MKKLMLLAIGLALSTFSKGQDSQPEMINASDPTQLYTKVDFNAGIYASGSSGLWGPDSWIVNIGGDFAIKKFNFGFNIPFSNLGNFYTLLEDIDLHAGFQPFNGDKLFKSSLITVGVILPASENDEWLYSTRKLYLNYTASLELTNKLSIFPTIGIETGSNIDENGPRFSLTSYRAGLGASYQFNAKNFLQLTSDYARTTRKLKDELIWFDDQNSLESNTVLVSLKYQYAITQNAQVYTLLQNDFGERFKNFEHQFELNQSGIFLGFQYYIK